MKLLNCALVALALSGAGCGSDSSESPVSPRVLQISGTVRYQTGTAVGYAKVWADGVFSAQTDPAGRFVITVPANGNSITLSARDGYAPGQAYGVIQYGSVHVVGRPGRITTDIVLDHADNI